MKSGLRNSLTNFREEVDEIKWADWMDDCEAPTGREVEDVVELGLPEVDDVKQVV
jgi:hypothetical protein